MASLVFSLLLGIGSNFDSFEWGQRFSPSFGTERRTARLLFAFCIAIVSIGACVLGGVTGHRIVMVLSRKACDVIGSAILVCIGLWILVQMMFSRRPLGSSQTLPTVTGWQVGFSEIMFLGLAQALSDLSIGLGIGFTKLNLLLVAGTVGLMSFISLWQPFRLGERRIWPRLNQGLTALSGVLFIVVGLFL